MPSNRRAMSIDVSNVPGPFAKLLRQPDDEKASSGVFLDAINAQLHPAAAEDDYSNGMVIGKTYAIPLTNIVPSEFNARVEYLAVEVEQMATSLQDHGQKLPALGYQDGKQVVLTDGVKRLRAARAGGIEKLDVKIEVRPASEIDEWMDSRRINLERSTHTHFDDAVRFVQMLDHGHFKNQDDLGKAVGISQPVVSRIWSLSKISPAVQMRMRQSDLFKDLMVAVEISRLFDPSLPLEQTEALAFDVIAKAEKAQMGKKQVQELVQSKLSGPKSRNRSDAYKVTYEGGKGAIKFNEARGSLQMVFSGLTPEAIKKLREDLGKLVAPV